MLSFPILVLLLHHVTLLKTLLLFLFNIVVLINKKNAAYRSFRDYGEAVLKHLENVTSSDPKLQKAAVNYEGVSVIFLVSVVSSKD